MESCFRKKICSFKGFLEQYSLLRETKFYLILVLKFCFYGFSSDIRFIVECRLKGLI